MLEPKVVFSLAKSSAGKIASLDIKERLNYVSKLKQVILKNSDSIIQTLSEFTHKDPFEVLSTEIFPTLTYCSWLENNAKKALNPRTVKTPIYMFGKSSKIMYSPFGVALIISPWNFPFYLSIVPTLTAFTAGNSVIIKPSEHTPFPGLIEDLLSQAQFPSGWITPCYGDGSTASELIDLKPDIVLFTGNTTTGTKVAQKTASYLIPTILELGGKDALVVCSDTDLAKAARGAIWGSYANSGQICTSTENIFIEESVYDEFKKYFELEIKKIHKLNCIYLDHHKAFLNKTFEYVATDPGVTIHGDYNNLTPSYTENLALDSPLVQKEVFGPMVNLIKFSSDKSLIETINSLGYGLAASVWTSSSKRKKLYLDELKVSSISINNVMATHENPHLPFGGVGKSGYGRYKGIEGLRSFCNQKSVVLDKLINTPEPHWFPYSKEKYELLSNMIKTMLSTSIMDKLKSCVYAIRFFFTRSKS